MNPRRSYFWFGIENIMKPSSAIIIFAQPIVLFGVNVTVATARVKGLSKSLNILSTPKQEDIKTYNPSAFQIWTEIVD